MSPDPNSLTNAETFNLTADCLGVIWQDAAGWHGCLKWDIEGNTDFVGPFADRPAALDAVRAAYAACL